MARFAFVRLVAVACFALSATCVQAQETRPPVQPVQQIAAERLSSSEAQAATESGLVFFTELLALATFGLTIATGVLAWFAYLQSRDMREQVQYANDLRAKHLADQLFEIDKQHIANPEIQVALENLRAPGSPPFLGLPKDELFVQMKVLIYMHLSLFDEIVSTYQERHDEAAKIELAAWQRYILEVMKQPPYKDVFWAEKHIFGEEFGRFMENHKAKIQPNGTPWVF